MEEIATCWRRKMRLHLKPGFQKHLSTWVTLTRGVPRPLELQKLEHFTVGGMCFQLLASLVSKRMLQKVTELGESIFPLYHWKIKELEYRENPKPFLQLQNFKSPYSKGSGRREGWVWFMMYEP